MLPDQLGILAFSVLISDIQPLQVFAFGCPHITDALVTGALSTTEHYQFNLINNYRHSYGH